MDHITTIILDVGGVLVLTKNTDGRKKWEAKLGLTPGQLSKEVFEMQPGELATVGDVKSTDIWESIQQKFALTDEQIREMQDDFYAGDVLNTTLFTLLQQLSSTYQIALLSNAWGNARSIYTKKYKLDTIPAVMIISAEEGLRKPQKEIYTKTLTKLNVRDCCTVLFIDDTDENVKAAEEAGMHGILFTDTDQTIADMRQHYNIIA